ncbi:phosphonate metabolism transcriptional regulator PhnF [Roseomonas terrae]|uniref:Phosphonate metabolism transcriptional regulator PhnF n=1 Tax=Neoroseomonas terrae TaxID=424799 RepID=A0ABS5EKN2_9PROT|nr:phosphonate metabolism transcriptional regulator PhnF [Neoroseomonas terrae]MBR0651580.1 phosphonate metabolism transcriptional regulator PhnF [Neoroseomonas terrae]
MTGPPLARGQGVALWRQIAAAIEGEIAQGAKAAGERLPTEAALTARFGVNRHTVRRALEDLEARGLIRVEQGRGAFVAEDVVDYRLGPRTRFSELVRRENREPAGRILRIGEVPAETQLAEALGIRRGRLVLRIDRLGLANGRPVVLGVHHLPLPRCAAAAEVLGTNSSITAALEASGIPDYRRQSSRITARLPTPEEADLLQQSRSRPVLVAESLNVDPEGQPVDWTMAIYAAGRVQLVVEP